MSQAEGTGSAKALGPESTGLSRSSEEASQAGDTESKRRMGQVQDAKWTGAEGKET